jgi:hypothetical protein
MPIEALEKKDLGREWTNDEENNKDKDAPNISFSLRSRPP